VKGNDDYLENNEEEHVQGQKLLKEGEQGCIQDVFLGGFFQIINFFLNLFQQFLPIYSSSCSSKFLIKQKQFKTKTKTK